MTSRVLSALFFWRNQSSTQAVDATPAALSPTQVHVFTTEIKTVEDSPAPSPSPSPTLAMTPLPAVYYSPYQQQASMVDDFFGRTGTVRSRDSQAFPPPYSSSAASEVPPAYPGSTKDEPPTLARFMFIYGFFFPPFWLMGIAILLSPLKPTPEWEMGKTEVERTTLLKQLRDEELKWARRCLWATSTLFALIAVIAVVVYLTAFRR